MKLTDSLVKAGLTLMRFKTGTPARVDCRTIDFSRTEPQYGDEAVRNFSFISPITERQQVPCYLTYTNPRTHQIIRDNLDRSCMFNGTIEGVGPRYCPSIEAKSSVLPIRAVISFFWNRKGSGPMKSMSRA